MRDRKSLVYLDASVEHKFIAGARNIDPVRGLTHGFYKYPARFSPAFVRSAIEAFTNPGDLVLDPHVGGGTTLVEALASGRDAIGIDISHLAQFVARVKTTVYSEAELDVLQAWSKQVGTAVNIHRPSVPFGKYVQLGYYKHLKHPLRWRLRKAIEQSLRAAVELGAPNMISFGRCAVLRTAQWALDGRSKLASVDEFRSFLGKTANGMVEGARALRAAVTANGRRQSVRVFQRSSIGLEGDHRITGLNVPKLVVTSPPYPGVHVLYHRWQVDGRKETPIPFMIADKLDGVGSSHYTMGDRKYPELKTYFDNIRASMSSVAALADETTIFVQMVAFSDPSWQLPRYLEAMEQVGLTECFLPALSNEKDGRLWRHVPGRRWYSEQRGLTPSSKEVVLIHRKENRRTS